MDNEWHGYLSSMKLTKRDDARLDDRCVEETLTTPITFGGKEGVWRKKEGRKEGKKERTKGEVGCERGNERKKVDVQTSLLRVILFHIFSSRFIVG